MSQFHAAITPPVIRPPGLRKLLRPGRLLLVGLVLSVAPLSGCSQRDDPYYRSGTWHPSGVNDMNIASQVADPHDLVHGRDVPQPNYRSSAQAVSDLWSGKTAKAAAAQAGAGGGASGGTGGTP